MRYFLKDPTNERFQQIFTDEERNAILQNNILVNFVPLNIFVDDSIEVIKRKYLLADAFINESHTTSFDELYLFHKYEVNLDATEVFQMLTNNDTLSLTKERLIQFFIKYRKSQHICS